MGDGVGFRVCVGNVWGRIREEKKDMITCHDPDLGFTVYDSIHEMKIASFFIKIIH